MSAVQDLKAKTIGVSLSFKWWGIRKAVKDSAKVEIASHFETSLDSLTISKHLINSRNPHYRKLTSLRNRIRKGWIDSSLPYVEDGIRLLRRDHVNCFDADMNEHRAELNQAMESFSSNWSSICVEAQGRLGKLFNANDYPPSVGNLFGFDLTWPNLEPPSYLMQLNPELYELEKQRMELKFQESLVLAEQAFATEFKALLDHLVERLQPDPTGEKKTFHASTVENLAEFFDKFKLLNVTGNVNIEELVIKAQGVLAGVTPKDLRTMENVRLDVGKSMAEITQLLEQRIVIAPSRKLAKRAVA